LKNGIKKIFLTGLAATIPIGLTIYVLVFIIDMMDGLVNVIPVKYRPDTLLDFHIPGLGLIATIILVFIIGLLTRSFLGKAVVGFGEAFFSRIPVIRSIYHSIKQIVDSLFMNTARNFKNVVLVEFPRKGCYTIGFVTGAPAGEIKANLKRHFTSIYVPTTPNPTSGYFVMIPEEELIYLEMSVEEAFTLVISTGIVNPVNLPRKKEIANVERY
jgi:uncharacterized membrane protein